MFLKELILKNFRGFEDFEVSFDERFNILLGENGSGKTSLLEGVKIALGTYFIGMKTKYATSLEISVDSDVRKVYDTKDETFQYRLPAEVGFEFEVTAEENAFFEDEDKSLFETNKIIKASRGKSSEKGNTTYGRNNLLVLFGKRAYEKIISGAHKNKTLPLVAAFGAFRMENNVRDTDNKASERKTRLAGYQDWHKAGATSKLKQAFWLEWLKEAEKRALDKQLADVQKGKALAENYRSNTHQAVLQAVENCLPSFKKIKYDLTEKDLVGELGGEEFMPFRLLSTGYQVYLATVAEIAYRCAVLNPHLGQEVLQKTSGVVLIDEIGLHMHPKWQQQVVERLQNTFPSLQFIVTTHSPLVTQNVKREQIILLEKGHQLATEAKENLPEDLGLWHLNQILESALFDMESLRSLAYQKKAEELRQLAEKVQRTPEEEQRFLALRQEIQAAPSMGSTPEEARLKQELFKLIQENLKAKGGDD